MSATDALELGIDIGLLDCVDLGRLPRHGRVPAPAVGPRRAPRPRARRARRERGRARPVLHARARDAARPARRGGDPRPREPARARRPRARGRLRGAARRRRPRRCSATRRSSGPPRCPSCSRRRPATSGPAATTRPRASSLRSTEPGRVHDRRRVDRRGARHRRARARLLDRPRGRGLPPPRRALPRRASSTSARARRVVEPFRGDYYTQAKKETTTAIVEPRRVETRLGLELAFGERRRHRAGRRATRSRSIRTQETLELVPLDLPQTDVRDRGGLVPARAVSSSRARARCRGCSARCTRPSTR